MEALGLYMKNEIKICIPQSLGPELGKYFYLHFNDIVTNKYHYQNSYALSEGTGTIINPSRPK